MPPADISLSPTGGLTVAEVARRYRISTDKIRAWIASGQLPAINTATALCGKPRFVILPHHLAEFERSRQVGPPAKQASRRRRRAAIVDYYPDDPKRGPNAACPAG